MNELKILLEIFALFILPVFLLYWKIIPARHRFRVLYAINIVALLFIIMEKWNLQKLGIRFDNFFSLLPMYAIFTLGGVAVLFLLANILKRKTNTEWKNHSLFFWDYSKISVLQETIYRGYLMPLLALLFSPFMVVIINALIFAFPHVIYPNKKINLPLIFLAGLAFAGIYLYYPNLILISISHIILNYTAVLFGFFTLEEVKRAN